MPHDDFLAAIREAPADPHARLVYADWLEERGDPRGEYLRTEHELARTSPFVDRYWDLKQRRDELRRGCEPDWLEGVGYPTYYTPLFTTVPEDRDECWRRVDRFVDFWHATPLDRTSGNTEEEIRAAEDRLGTPLPAALREWYRLAGRRTEIWSKQDHWLALGEIAQREDNDYLCFRYENQAVESWGVRLDQCAGADPSVYRLEDNARIDSPSTMQFALQQLLMESMWKAPVFARCEDPHAVTDWFVEKCRRAGLPRTYWVFDPVFFHEGNDAFVVDGGQSDDFLYAAFRTEAAWERLPESIRSHMIRWDPMERS